MALHESRSCRAFCLHPVCIWKPIGCSHPDNYQDNHQDDSLGWLVSNTINLSVLFKYYKVIVGITIGIEI